MWYVKLQFLFNNISISLIFLFDPASSVTINLQDSNLTQKCSVYDSLGRGTYVGNYWKRWVLWTPLLPLILLLPGLVQIGSRHILEQSYGQSKHSSTQQTMTEGYAQPPEHQNVPPPLHLHSCTQLLSELNFWIWEVKVFMNLTSCISTTCRHPLVIPQLHCWEHHKDNLRNFKWGW